VSDHNEHPTAPGECRKPGRRRSAPARASSASRQPRSRDTCPERPRLLNPEHEAFVDWFVTYWRSNGAQLFESTSKEA